jgi:hypothetical protein
MNYKNIFFIFLISLYYLIPAQAADTRTRDAAIIGGGVGLIAGGASGAVKGALVGAGAGALTSKKKGDRTDKYAARGAAAGGLLTGGGVSGAAKGALNFYF